MGPPGSLRNFGGCARQFYSACPGGSGGDLDILGGVLRPCYKLGAGACNVITGQCACPADQDSSSCTPQFLELNNPNGISIEPSTGRRRYTTDSMENKRGAGAMCTCPSTADRLATWFLTRSHNPQDLGQSGTVSVVWTGLPWFVLVVVGGGWLGCLLPMFSCAKRWLVQKRGTGISPSGKTGSSMYIADSTEEL